MVPDSGRTVALLFASAGWRVGLITTAAVAAGLVAGWAWLVRRADEAISDAMEVLG